MIKLVGKIKEAHGIRGDLYLIIFSGDPSWLDNKETLQLGRDEKALRSFLIQKMRRHRDGMIVHVEGVDTRNQAEDLVGWGVFAQSEDFVSQPGEVIYLEEILHFSLQDVENRPLGVVEGFSSNGPQDLLQIKTERGIFLVPFVSPWIRSIDFNNKILVMELPSGLLGDEGSP